MTTPMPSTAALVISTAGTTVQMSLTAFMASFHYVGRGRTLDTTRCRPIRRPGGLQAGRKGAGTNRLHGLDTPAGRGQPCRGYVAGHSVPLRSRKIRAQWSL